ncbi:MAG: GtrA family protein [Lachnospiraceae bacterium]|nr:GtrA family protein [Lachnospiraceae bacterium]
MKERKKDLFDRIMERPGLRVFEPFYQKHREVLLYLLFGGLTTFISIGSYGYLIWLGVEPLLANVISWILAVLFAYVTNSTWVFEARPQGWGERCRQIFSFYGGRVATLLLEEAILLLFVELLGWNAMLVKVAGQVLVVAANYIISKLWVFRKK